ncbi:TRAP transporter large permease [Undibacter mobilis]|uniref:TRAP transporter large permease protein n=1 Tax=Undibacter mobilis TaxID=2292256 RepID=A0A371B7V0_9BRAD|nr:TRAP transporter large permease [Undibacter mobilis]RDV03577.1 TRAP transporter large permease [Undibacter mobilis]
MTATTIGVIGLASLVVLILLRIPVAVALGLVGFFGYAALDGFGRANLMISGVPVEFASTYTLSVVPLFTLMGAVAASAGLSSDLFQAGRVLFRGARGSLAIASIFASAMFGAVCGSSVATALTMSKVSIPEMLRAKYPPALAAGAVAAGGTLGILIPPSLILMIYAIIAQQSVAKLFMAALIPGIILTVLYSITALIYYRWLTGNAPEPEYAQRQSDTLVRSFARIWHVILLFGITLGGIYAGWFTPTEAAAIGALGAILLGLVLGRHKMSDTVACFFETISLVSSLVFIVIASAVFSYFVVQTGVSNQLIGVVKGIGLGAIGIITAVCVLYIVLGAFLEGIGMLLITVPITLPLVLSYGYDPVWFGVLLVILIELGLIHPPMGMNLFAINAVTKDIGILDIYKGSVPFLIAPLLLIVLMIMFPQIVLWLPAQLH